MKSFNKNKSRGGKEKRGSKVEGKLISETTELHYFLQYSKHPCFFARRYDKEPDPLTHPIMAEVFEV